MSLTDRRNSVFGHQKVSSNGQRDCQFAHVISKQRLLIMILFQLLLKQSLPQFATDRLSKSNLHRERCTGDKENRGGQ